MSSVLTCLCIMVLKVLTVLTVHETGVRQRRAPISPFIFPPPSMRGNTAYCLQGMFAYPNHSHDFHCFLLDVDESRINLFK